MPQVEIIMPTKAEAVRPTRIAAYCRVSSESDDQVNSFVAQVRHYSTTVTGMPNCELVDIYADEGISGSTIEKRDEFKRLLADCSKGKIDRIITKTVSRFARNTLECLETVRDLKLKGISVYFEEQHFDTQNMADELLITMFGSVAQSEALSISKNLKIMNRKRMEAGEYLSSKVPYGYRYRDRAYVIHAQEAEVVRRIFEAYLSGAGPTAIANQLNNEHVPTNAQGKRWYCRTVYEILSNEKYIGDTRYQKTYRGDELPFPKYRNHGELTQYYKQGTHDGIIERDTFEQVQQLIAQRRREPNMKREEKAPLTNTIRCESCGAQFKRAVVRGKTYWVCSRHAERKLYCGTPPVPEWEIEESFIKMFNKLRDCSKQVLTPVITSLGELRDATMKDDTELRAMDKRIAELSDKKLLLARLRSKGIMDETTYLADAAQADQELEKLRQNRKQMVRGDDDLEQITQLKHLQETLAKSAPVATFDSDTYLDIVERAVVSDRKHITFCLSGGLELTERLGEQS